MNDSGFHEDHMRPLKPRFRLWIGPKSGATFMYQYGTQMYCIFLPSGKPFFQSTFPTGLELFLSLAKKTEGFHT